MSYRALGLVRQRPACGLGSAVPTVFDAQGVLSQLTAQHLEQLNHALKSISANIQEDMKEVVIKAAAAQTGISIALSAIPVVGWAASAILGVVQSFSNDKYRKEAEAVMADASNDIAKMQSDSQIRILNKLGQVFSEEKGPAIQLLMQSVQTAPLEEGGMNGLGSLHGWGSGLAKSVKKLVDKAGIFKPFEAITKGLRKLHEEIEEGFQKGLDYFSGRVVKTEAREAADKLRKAAASRLADNEATVISLVDSPQYRQNLRVSIADELLKNPQIQQMIDDIGRLRTQAATAQPGQVTVPSVDVKTVPPGLPLAAGAGVALLAYLLMD